LCIPAIAHGVVAEGVGLHESEKYDRGELQAENLRHGPVDEASTGRSRIRNLGLVSMTTCKDTPSGGLPSNSDIENALYEIVEPYIVKRLGTYSRDRTFSGQNLLRIGALLFKKGRKARDMEFVKERYEENWENVDLSKFRPDSSNTCYGNWQGELFEMVRHGPKRAHLYVLSEIFDSLRPKKVLEVGCGIGVNLAFLCRRFPITEFSGLELTESGIKRAKKIVKNPPKELIDFYPFSVSPKQIYDSLPVLHQASAGDLPFEDNSFDLVYSVQALEQMNRIRFEVFKEIYRVTSDYACFIEAFKDYNKGSLALNMIERDYFRGSIKELNDHGLKVEMIYDDLPTKNKMKIVCVLARKT
jgi:ubiquinone/menaquinone biosynthesis C-methylase UbiE